MTRFVLQCLWYLLPAALANHVASCGQRLWLPSILKDLLAKIAVPVDFGAKWRGTEIFGPHKTWRGIAVGVVTGIVVSGIQEELFFNVKFFRYNTLVDYGSINFMFFGSLMGGGALTGDLVKSFFKRRLGKPSGKPWFPWDQLDWILGAMAASCLLYIPPAEAAITTTFLYVIVHLCSDRMVYHMGIKKREEVN